MTKSKTASQSVQGEAEVQATTSPEPEVQAPAPGLDLQDLAGLTAIVQTAVKRGAFEMDELEPVIAAHKKVSAFLQYQAQMQAATQAAQKAETEGES